MCEQDLGRYRGRLEEELAILSRQVRSRDDIHVQQTPDSIDETQSAIDRDFAVQNLTREALRLRSVREALQRLRQGLFGECVECGKPIAERRLEAIPWAACCRDCQERLDREQDEAVPLLKTA